MTNSERRDRNIFIGTQIATLLNLKFDAKGETKTDWGTKTREGLGAVITRITEDAVNQFGGEITDTILTGDVRMVCNNSMDARAGIPAILSEANHTMVEFFEHTDKIFNKVAEKSRTQLAGASAIK
jgi:hypothetical protein